MYTILFHIKKQGLIILSDIARLIPGAPHHLFEMYFHFFFRTYRFEQRSGERNTLPYFYFSTPEEQSCIVESCITERLTTRTIYYITEYILDPNESRIFFLLFSSCTFLFPKKLCRYCGNRKLPVAYNIVISQGRIQKKKKHYASTWNTSAPLFSKF